MDAIRGRTKDAIQPLDELKQKADLKSIISKTDLIVSPIYRSFTYPVWLWCMIFGRTFLILVAITLDITFVSTFTRKNWTPVLNI